MTHGNFRKMHNLATLYRKKKIQTLIKPSHGHPLLLRSSWWNLSIFLVACLLFPLVFLEQGVEDLQGGSHVPRDDICGAIHRKQSVLAKTVRQ